MFNFKNEYLTPNEAIEASEEEFANFFSYSLPNEEHRTELFEYYQAFIQAFSKEITPSFEVWIGGSFTTKKELPNDIDLVIFADYQIFQGKEKEFKILSANQKADKKRLDIHKVEVYPKSHKNYKTIYEPNWYYWLDWFSHTRKNRRTKKRQSRGFIKIIYHE